MFIFFILFLYNTAQDFEEYYDENQDSNTSYEETKEYNKPSFNTSTFEGRIHKYYYDREMISDESWKEKIGNAFSETYVIEAGDTLWAISEKFLDSPYYWPKIWALNPYITNPHLIYPGNQIVFKFYAEDIPQLMIGELDTSEEEAIRTKNLTDYSVLEKEIKPSLFDSLGFFKSRLASAPNITKNKSNYSFYLARNIENLGKIIIPSNKNLYVNDLIYINKNKNFNCSSGIYSIVNRYKNLYNLAGELTIIDTNNCHAKLHKVYDLIDKNSIITKLITFNDNSFASKSQKELKGSLLAINKDLFAEGDTIFVQFNKDTPNINELLFIYENNILTGIAKVIFIDKNYITAIITAANKPLNKKMLVSTK